MKITFLGTSHGYPGKNRFCTSYMLEAGEDIYLIDAGAPICDLMYRREISFDRIKSIFITHSHLDHMQGLPHFLGTAKWHFPDCVTKTYLPDEKSMNALKPLLADRPEQSNSNLLTIMYGEGEIYKDDNIKVRAISNKHLQNINGKSYGFEIETEGKLLLFTGDLTDTMEDFPAAAFEKHFDIIITECAHAKPETLEKKLTDAKPDIAAVNHVYPPYKEEYFKNLSKEVDFKIIVGQDNDELII